MFYSHSDLDRLDHLRADEAAIGKFWSNPQTRVLPLWQNKVLVERKTPTTPQACSIPVSSLPDTANKHTFLGFDGTAHWFAAELDKAEPDLNSLLQDSPHAAGNSEFEDLRVAGPLLPATESALLVYARAINIWQNNSPFCSRCGQPAKLGNAGHVRVCSNENCGYFIFPRTDPAVIMLVVDGNDNSRCLMGRNKAWPSGVFSTLAGFVEAGETLENAVAREVHEETGVVVHDVQYVASQPWPFPRSIMLGFKAIASSTELYINEDELDDARWFTREEMRTFGDWGEESDRMKLPRPDSIARFLIDSWMSEESD